MLLRSDEEGIRRTLALYSQLCDDGRFDEFGQLFTADAVFRVLGREHVGRDAIEAFMASAQPPEARGRHITSNTVIELEREADIAGVTTDYLFVAAMPSGGGFAITSVGRYHDEMVRGPHDEWLFSSREIVFLGS